MRLLILVVITIYLLIGFSSADVSTEAVIGQMVDFGEFVGADSYAYFWLVGHDANDDIDVSDVYAGDNVDICFNSYDGGMAVYYFGMSGGSYGVIRRVYNVDGATNLVENGIASGTGQGGCSDDYDISIENFDTRDFRYSPINL